jgi:tetratricopeptide (TPR) repeat protein
MAASSFGDEFAKAVAFHRRGQLDEAERVCHTLLNADARHFGARYLLGVIALQRSQFQIAEQQIALALALNPNAATANRDRGVALARLGRTSEALTCLDRAIALRPDDPDAHGNRGNVLRELGRFADALECHDKAIALRPASPILHYNRGIMLHDLDRLEEALASQERAIMLKPDYANAFNKRGMVLWALERYAEALASYDTAVALKPDFVDAYYNRGLALQDLGRPDEAIESYDRAIALAPDLAAAWSNRGNALQKLGKLEAALESYDRALAISLDFTEAHYNRGVTLLALKRPEDALASYERAIALKPDHPEVLFSRGVCNLLLGRMQKGAWDDYENRWRMRNYPAAGAGTEASHWAGENLTGRSILVYAEQGLGDIIQFCRLAPLLAERGAEVSFLLPAKLHRLLSGLPGDICLLTSLQSRRFDFQCDLQSLPRGLGLELANIPVRIPYLAVDAERADYWHNAIGSEGFRIGIAWHGARWHNGVEILGRSVPLREFYPLSQIRGVRLISLQKNDGVEQLAALPAGMRVETLGEAFDAGLDAFADTAAAMQHFDLVVTCDTSVAHLAGALGRPVWIALKYVPEWRWMLDRDDSPWYPSARLFRQKSPDDWSAVIGGMLEVLRKRLAVQPSGGRNERP